MIYWEVFLAFFIPSILGYGGGPAFIPLIENEVVGRYGWLSVSEFGEVLALANTLPGPIATKIAGYIGYSEAGVFGALVGVFSTVAPSLLLMIFLMNFLFKHKDSPKVKRMTLLVLPTIVVLLGIMTCNFFATSYFQSGIWQTLVLVIISFFALEKWKIHPAYVICVSLIYGAVIL